MSKDPKSLNSDQRGVTSKDAFRLLVRNATHLSHFATDDSTGSLQPPKSDSISMMRELRNEYLPRARKLVENRPDPFELANKLLEYVFAQLQSRESCESLILLLESQPLTPSGPSIRLIALCQLAPSLSSVTRHLANVTLGYSQVLESLLQGHGSLRASIYTSLHSQFKKFANEEDPWMKCLDLYCLLLVAESCRVDESCLALDLFSDSFESVLEYTRVCDWEQSHQRICELVLSAITHRHDAIDCLKAFVHLQPRESVLPELSLADSNQLLHDLILSSTMPAGGLSTACYWYRRLYQRDLQGDSSRLFALALRNLDQSSTKGAPKRAQQIGAAIESMMDSGVESARLQSLEVSIGRGDFASTTELLVAMNRIGDMAQVDSVAHNDVLTGSAIKQVERLQTRRGSQMVSPELLRMRLDRWEQVSEIHHGFTSWLMAAKRGPFREPPDLVQFAIDVGNETSVRYLNAKDPHAFPGKGYFLTRLQTSRCFATTQAEGDSRRRRGSGDPFSVYKRAWPDLAEAIDHFSEAEFVFLRGFVLISCKHRDYLLPNPRGEHYSLLVFNDHFRNPFQDVAYLVPNQGIAQLFAKTQIGYADYVGFDARRPDINDVLRSPQAFLNHESIRDKAIDVGSVSAVLNGFESHQHRLAAVLGHDVLVKRFADLETQISDYNNRVRDWEARSHLYHLSPQGIIAMAQLSRTGYALEREQDLLSRNHAGVQDAVEKSVWQLVDRYIALHKLFRIAHAYWHRGYTAGRAVSTQEVSESNLWLDTSVAPPEQSDLRIDSTEEPMINRNSIRMLAMAYEWHSMRDQPNTKRDDFPVLVKCDALQLGARPELDWYLDTYDMTAFIDGRKTEMTQGKMTADDELFWLSHLFPLVQDRPGQIVDLRFYPRSSVGLP